MAYLPFVSYVKSMATYGYISNTDRRAGDHRLFPTPQQCQQRNPLLTT